MGRPAARWLQTSLPMKSPRWSKLALICLPVLALGASHWSAQKDGLRKPAEVEMMMNPEAHSLEEMDSDERDFLLPEEARSNTASGAAASSEGIHFSRACESGKRLTIAAVGDVLLHSPLAKQGLADRDGFASLWSGVSTLLSQADVTYANLEGPVAGAIGKEGKPVRDPGRVFDDVAYTSYSMFNYHPSLIKDLITSGIDVVSTANNHAMDRKALGADRTIENLKGAGLPFSGTRLSNGQGSWFTTTSSNGFTLAWVACTFSTNGIADTNAQVFKCYEQKDELISLVKQLSKNSQIDAVIVTPHWGIEYETLPRAQEKTLAHTLLDAGATAILGSHPHVLQPMEKYKTQDGREAFIIYSLGNFVSGQKQLAKRTAALVYLGLTRGESGKVFVNGVRYVPTEMSYGAKMNLVPRDGVGESRAFALQILGSGNVMKSTDPVDTTPQCD